MTSPENSTNNLGDYSGLNLRAVQLLTTEDVVIDELTSEKLTTAGSEIIHSSEAQVGLMQDGRMQDSQAENKTVEQESISLPPPSESAMQDYHRLQQNLLGITVVFGALIFPFIWGFYSLQIALDYILGACGGVVYLRMLGRNVSNIGRQKKNSSIGRLAIFAGLMIVSLRWEQLEVIPVFLGFLTYKAAIIAFVLWTSVRPQREAA